MTTTNRVDVGQRGAFWLEPATRRSNGRLPSHSLVPRFGSTVDDEKAASGPIQPCSTGAQVYPPFRIEESRPTKHVAEPALKEFREAFSEFDDAPDELLQQLSIEQGGTRQNSASGRKIILSGYVPHDRRILLLTVGGPRDEHIYVSPMVPEDGRNAESNKRAKIRPSLVPAYTSSSPIIALDLAPAHPPVAGFRHHEGPWISVLTLTGLHICAVHRIPDKAHGSAKGSRAQFVLSHIATFLTKEVDRVLRRERERGVDGKVFALGSRPVVDVLWDSQSRTRALILDQAGNIWEWTVDLSVHHTHQWLHKGQKLSKIMSSPFTPAELPKPSSMNLLWADELDRGSAILFAGRQIWIVDLDTPRATLAHELLGSSLQLRAAHYRDALHLALPSQPYSLFEDRPTLPIVAAASSEAIHFFDALNPRRELLTVTHGRGFCDESLRLHVAPGACTGDSAVVLLTSDCDSVATLYTVTCHLQPIADDRLQATRAWQSAPPTELPLPFPSQHGLEVKLVRWADWMSDHESWHEWNSHVDQSPSSWGKWAVAFRTGSGEVWIQAFDRHGHFDSQDNCLAGSAFQVETTVGDQMLRNFVETQKGRFHQKAIVSSVVSGDEAIEPVNLAAVWDSLCVSFSTRPENSRQTEVIDSMHESLTQVVSIKSMMTALDIFALASTSREDDAPRVTPMASARGAISAFFAPHTLLAAVGGATHHLDAGLASALARCRCSGSTWWDGSRGSTMRLPFAHVREAESAEEHHWQQVISRYVAQYAFLDEGCRRSLFGSMRHLVLQCALASEVWSPSAVTVPEQRPALDRRQTRFSVSHAVASLERPGPWNAGQGASPEPTRPGSRGRRRSGTASSLNASRSHWQASQATERPQAVEGIVEDMGDDVEQLAKRRVPEPEGVHFAFFKPVRPGGSSQPATTVASRLLLSSWPLTSLDPTDNDNDPSFYTYSDPYVLLDAARGQSGYGTSDSGTATDREGTGWSSAWTSDTGASSAADSDAASSRSRSRSVWSMSQPVSMQHSSGWDRTASSSVQPPADASRWQPLSQSQRAPPSIASSSQRIKRPGEDYAEYPGLSQEQLTQTGTDTHAVADTATQPVAGQFASRKQPSTSKSGAHPNKKRRKRIGGF
ncbi:unnamed protein product [Jaminaea pallidilutea]